MNKKKNKKLFFIQVFASRIQKIFHKLFIIVFVSQSIFIFLHKIFFVIVVVIAAFKKYYHERWENLRKKEIKAAKAIKNSPNFVTTSPRFDHERWVFERIKESCTFCFCVWKIGRILFRFRSTHSTPKHPWFLEKRRSLCSCAFYKVFQKEKREKARKVYEIHFRKLILLDENSLCRTFNIIGSPMLPDKGRYILEFLNERKEKTLTFISFIRKLFALPENSLANPPLNRFCFPRPWCWNCDG